MKKGPGPWHILGCAQWLSALDRPTSLLCCERGAVNSPLNPWLWHTALRTYKVQTQYNLPTDLALVGKQKSIPNTLFVSEL